MTAQPGLVAALERQPPPAGGFSPAIVRLEIRRLLRNRRTMILALALPVLFFWGFGLNSSYVHETAGHGNVSAVEMISIALYGAVSATATCGAMVSIERVAGWSRQLRVTPLSPAAYVVIKMLTSLVLAAGAVAAVYLVGAVTNKASMPADLWVITGLCVWVGSLLFAAFGLCTGYLLPSENVTQVIGLALTLCAFAGGLFIPLSQFSPDLQTFAKFTPLYGLSQLVHYPLAGGTLQWSWILNLVVWLAIFVVGAVWSLRRDTARVLSSTDSRDHASGRDLSQQVSCPVRCVGTERMQQACVGQHAVGSGRVRRRRIITGGQPDQHSQPAPVRDAELLISPMGR
jgi:ABC-2 type transport system permease protein